MNVSGKHFGIDFGIGRPINLLRMAFIAVVKFE